MRLRFLGANRQITGSSTLVEAAGLRVLVDHGLFQERPFLSRNWQELPVPPSSIDFMLLTHAHLDHTGRIPRLVQAGYANPILATAPTIELARIVLEDAAAIQVEDAAAKKRRHERDGRRGPYPEIPLYTPKDVPPALALFRRAGYATPIALNNAVTVTFRDAGHILGSAWIEIAVTEGGRRRSIVFSGDLGQEGRPIVEDPAGITAGEYVVIESTYGHRDHDRRRDVGTQLAEHVNDTVARGGNVVIPTFALERAQELLFHLGILMEEKRLPPLPVYLDSPMAADATEVLVRHLDFMDDETRARFLSRKPFAGMSLRFTRSVEDSKAINTAPGPKIILASSGMCTGGRIKHHLRSNIGSPQSMILFIGHQAEGTLGHEILAGRDPVRIHGRNYAVRARVARITGWSGHADRSGLQRWLAGIRTRVESVFVNHGTADAAESLARTIHSDHGWKVRVPALDEEIDLE